MTTSIGQLDSYFTSLVSSTMRVESQPLARLAEARDAINIKRSVYQDLNGMLRDLQALAKPLTTTNAFSALSTGRQAAVSNVATGYNVLSASTANTAVVGTYDISVNLLALQHRVRSDAQTYSNQALGFSGTFTIGGAAARAQVTQATVADTVTGFGTADLAEDQVELGTGAYYVETRNDATAGWQFRVVDADGRAMSVQSAASSETYTANWQSLPVGGGLYDTGRGLTVDFGTDSGLYQAAAKGSGAAQAAYTAQGAAISVGAGDTLIDIANAINEATYANGNGVSATVVNRQLVLTAQDTGTAHAVVAADSTGTVLQQLGVVTAGGAFKNPMQTARDASFTVNGLSVTRGANTGIDDVIDGVTLNLASDAEGRTASLKVSANVTAMRSAIDAFLDKFNEVQAYLETKSSVTSSTVDGVTTYSRGSLADDSIFNDLRNNLFNLFMSDSPNAGNLKNLRDLGLTLNDSLQASVADEDKLAAALTSDLDNAGALFDTFMGNVDTLLGRFTGSSNGYLNSVLQFADRQITEADQEINRLNLFLADREQSLLNQFAEMQVQLLEATYMQQQWSSIYGGVSRLG